MASPSGVSIRGSTSGAPYDRVLTPEAVAFVAQLARSSGPRVDELLARRKVVQVRLEGFFSSSSFLPSFLLAPSLLSLLPLRLGFFPLFLSLVFSLRISKNRILKGEKKGKKQSSSASLL